MKRNITKDFLLELGTEELPPQQLGPLAEALAKNLQEQCAACSIQHGEAKIFATPRRLAVLILNMANRQPEQQCVNRGPAVDVAFDVSGTPTIAATKFAATCGVKIEQLIHIEEKRGKFLAHRFKKPGKHTHELLPEIISTAIKKLPLQRAMYWHTKHGPFARPLHWLLTLFGSDVVPVTIFGIKATNKTYGHRFHCNKSLTIIKPPLYASILAKKGMVLADMNSRKQEISKQITALAKNTTPLPSDELLNLVTHLTEWPVALDGTFNKSFLQMPQEVLITTLTSQQLCFPLVNIHKQLTQRFIMVTNIMSHKPARVIAGNEKVVHARLADAQYFYTNDLKCNLADNINLLARITFQEQLGSVYDKALRLQVVGTHIAAKIGANPTDVERAALLAKCDLITSMVGEFPELQGIMGYYYAKSREKHAVAYALREQYLPRFAQDQLPQTPIGMALALADRIDTLVGFFRIKKMPTGDKDPFGLRRAALGVVRIILEKQLDLNLVALIQCACTAYHKRFANYTEAQTALLDFIYERLRFSYSALGKSNNIFNAVLASNPANLLDFSQRFDAVENFIQQANIDDLIIVYKRVKNILTKNVISSAIQFDSSLAKEPAEIALTEVVAKKQQKILALQQAKKYPKLLQELSTCKKPLDRFFNKVMVMTDDITIRNNRLALLKSVYDLFLLVADITYLVAETKEKDRFCRKY